MIILAISLWVLLSTLTLMFIKGATQKTPYEQLLEDNEQMDYLKNIKKGKNYV